MPARTNLLRIPLHADTERAKLDRAAELRREPGTATWARKVLLEEAERLIAAVPEPAPLAVLDMIGWSRTRTNLDGVYRYTHECGLVIDLYQECMMNASQDADAAICEAIQSAVDMGMTGLADIEVTKHASGAHTASVVVYNDGGES